MGVTKKTRTCLCALAFEYIVLEQGEIMIELVSIDGLTVPKIFCGTCGEEISNAKHAAVVFSNFMGNTERTGVTYVHKNFVVGSCMTQAEELIRAKGEQPGWAELSEHLAYLISNVGMGPTDIEKKLSYLRD